jgi:hypothetical protein
MESFEIRCAAGWVFLGALLLVLLILLATQLISLRRNAAWVLSLRREQLLSAAVMEVGQALADPKVSREVIAEILMAHNVRLADEISNQLRHEADVIPRPPKIGRQWPDFMPARISYEEEKEPA